MKNAWSEARRTETKQRGGGREREAFVPRAEERFHFQLFKCCCCCELVLCSDTGAKVIPNGRPGAAARQSPLVSNLTRNSLNWVLEGPAENSLLECLSSSPPHSARCTQRSRYSPSCFVRMQVDTGRPIKLPVRF
ncbi:hypothetical protein L596_018909 [Steinernema carpocapsae]|uniref:Uncharacterized protein n=1 Tax=Steinernema carpocapsae TaxID=34508 RepID=A0A4U5N615_STECR|nr:hypothetical protein L596_018909 [Steinernema carpocapsae]